MANTIQHKRGPAANWTSTDPTLAAGEVGFETDTGKIKVGDGTSAWSALGYFEPAAPPPRDFSLYSNNFATSVNGSAAATGEGSYTDSNGIWTPTLSSFTSDVAWNSSGYMDLDSRTDSTARFYLDIPSAYLNNYRYVSWISTIHVVSKDNFGSALEIQDGRASQYDNLISAFRVDHSVLGGQGGGHMGHYNTTEASNAWDNSGGFNWYNNQLQVQYWFDTSNNTGKLVIAGYDCIVVGVGDANAALDTPFVGDCSFVFGNYREGGPGDNGIEMRVYGTEIAAWNGEFSERPTVLYP